MTVTEPRIPAPYQASVAEREQMKAIVAQANRTSCAWTTTTGSSSHTAKPPLSEANAVYGTTPPETIQLLLETIDARGHFVDAGSGLGLPCLTAALSNRFHTARGIEYVESHHAQALGLKTAYGDDQCTTQCTAPSMSPHCRLDYGCAEQPTCRRHRRHEPISKTPRWFSAMPSHGMPNCVPPSRQAWKTSE
jgi:hypothetical protein